MDIRTAGKRDRIIGRPIHERFGPGLIRAEKFAHREQVRRAIVVAVGEKHQDQVKPGDTLIIGNFAGTKIHFNGEELLAFEEDEVFAVEEPNG